MSSSGPPHYQIRSNESQSLGLPTLNVIGHRGHTCESHSNESGTAMAKSASVASSTSVKEDTRNGAVTRHIAAPAATFLAPDSPPNYPDFSQRPALIAICAFLLAFALFASIVILIVMLFVYMYVWHTTRRDGSGILVTGADPTRLVAITSFITDACSYSVPISMGVVASSVAAKWWQKSQNNNNDRDNELPTALHLGVVSSVLASAGPMAAYHALGTMIGGISMPKYIRNACFTLVVLLATSYIVASLDYVLHWTTKPYDVIETNPIIFTHQEQLSLNNFSITASFGRRKRVDAQSLLYSRTFNTTKCDKWREDPANENNQDSCGLENASNNVAYLSIPEMKRTLSNSSSTNMIVWANDNTALVVPAERTSISYTASTFAANSTCQSITQECVQCTADSAQEHNCPDHSDEASLTFNCPNLNTSFSAGISSTGYVEGVIDPITNTQIETNGTFFSGLAQTKYAFVGLSYAYAGSSTNGTYIADGVTDDQTGFVVWGHQGGLNVVDCNVTILQANYVFTPPSNYTILNSTMALLNESRYLTFNTPSSQDITAQIDGFGAINGTMTYAQGAALQVSKQLLGGASVLYDTSPALEVSGVVVHGSKVQEIVLFIFLALAIFQATIILLTGIVAAIVVALTDGCAQSLLKERLIEPHATLADLYGPFTNIQKHALSTSGKEYFKESDDNTVPCSGRLRAVECVKDDIIRVTAYRKD